MKNSHLVSAHKILWSNEYYEKISKSRKTKWREWILRINDSKYERKTCNKPIKIIYNKSDGIIINVKLKRATQI